MLTGRGLMMTARLSEPPRERTEKIAGISDIQVKCAHLLVDHQSYAQYVYLKATEFSQVTGITKTKRSNEDRFQVFYV